MRLALVLFTSFAASASGAVIRGVVTENLTGSPLARTLIQIQPVGGGSGTSRSLRAGDRGTFEFSGLAAGGWIVRASRPGFLPLENGQRKWNSAGFPLILTADEASFVSLRLQRTAALTGTVRDDNEIGMRDFDVVAYKTTRPPEIAARAKTDDRGVYRLSGLEPGIYLVRSSAHTEEELNFIPTFAPASIPMENARTVELFADEEAKNSDLRPQQGKLFRLSGMVSPIPIDITNITVTLASEMGREVRHGPGFSFAGLAAGDYELYAEALEDPPGTRFLGGYVHLTLSQNNDAYNLSVRDVRETQFTFTPDNGRGHPPGQLFVRRKDLAGVGVTTPATLTRNSVMLGPGRWDLLFLPNPGSYVSSFFGNSSGRVRAARADGWNEIVNQAFGTSVRYGITGGGARLSGVVKQSGEIVVGAPVFLEPWDPSTRTRVAEVKQTRSGLSGDYQFDGLPPGDYRILSTFEYGNPDPAAFDLAMAPALHIDAHQATARDLDLFGAK